MTNQVSRLAAPALCACIGLSAPALSSTDTPDTVATPSVETAPDSAPSVDSTPIFSDLTPPTLSETDPRGWAKVDGWDIAWYPEMRGCQAFALFEENTAFFIGYDKTHGKRSLNITLIDKRWTKIKDGDEHRVQVRFGDNPAWDLTMDGRSIDDYPALMIHMSAAASETRTLINQFRRESEMRWQLEDQQLARLTLRGSRRAFSAVQDCEANYAAPPRPKGPVRPQMRPVAGPRKAPPVRPERAQ